MWILILLMITILSALDENILKKGFRFLLGMMNMSNKTFAYYVPWNNCLILVLIILKSKFNKIWKEIKNYIKK